MPSRNGRPGERKMVTSRFRAMILLGGVLLSSVGCMVPMYRMPAGYSGSYARYLDGGAGDSGEDALADTPAQRSGNRDPKPAASSRSGAVQTPVGEQPPQPPRS